MSAAIIILVIVLILLLVGLGVVLYFAFRRTDGPTGGTGPRPPPIPPAPTGPTGVTGPTGNFSIAPNNGFQGVWGISSNTLVVESTSSSDSCNNYRFRNTNTGNITRALVWEGDGTSVLCSSGIGAPITLVNPNSVTNTDDCSWVYDTERLTWHLANNSSSVMQTETTGTENIVRLANLGATGATGTTQWIATNLPTSSLPCMN